MIVVDKLSFSYGKNQILENVSFSIEANQLIGIVGPNGGGKTTLLNLLLGFLKPSFGKIHLGGVSPYNFRTHIGYVPQVNTFDPLFPITVLEVILMGASSQKKPFKSLNAAILDKASLLLESLGLKCKEHENFFSLSGGQAQRVLIARALINDPKILILDEPTSNIDQENEKILFNILKKLKATTTILMVSHSLRTLTQEVDGALLVNKSVCFLKPEELCNHYSLGIFHPPLQINRT
jgi:zinc transport system ATP-binding protein